jgi:hypothetical protein
MSDMMANQRKACRDLSAAISKINRENTKNKSVPSHDDYKLDMLLDGVKDANLKIQYLLRSEKRYRNYLSDEEKNILYEFTLGAVQDINIESYRTLLDRYDEIKSIVRQLISSNIEDIKEAYLNAAIEVEKEFELIGATKNEILKIHENVIEMNSGFQALVKEIESDRNISNDLMVKIKEKVAQADDYHKRSEETNGYLDESRNHVTKLLENVSNEVVEIEKYIGAIIDCKKTIDIVMTKEVEFDRKMTLLNEEREEHKKTAMEIINDAKTALGYTTARALSDAFDKQHQEAKKEINDQRWLNYSVGFLVAALLLGLWVLSGAEDVTLTLILSRLSIMPLMIAGAWFCSNQFVKQKYLAEDYAYKTVLAKSIVGFSEQLSSESNKGEEYKKYIEKVLEEIHRDPIRKDTKSDDKKNELENFIKSVGDLKMVVEKLSDPIKKHIQ